MIRNAKEKGQDKTKYRHSGRRKGWVSETSNRGHNQKLRESSNQLLSIETASKSDCLHVHPMRIDRLSLSVAYLHDAKVVWSNEIWRLMMMTAGGWIRLEAEFMRWGFLAPLMTSLLLLRVDAEKEPLRFLSTIDANQRLPGLCKIRVGIYVEKLWSASRVRRSYLTRIAVGIVCVCRSSVPWSTAARPQAFS